MSAPQQIHTPLVYDLTKPEIVQMLRNNIRFRVVETKVDDLQFLQVTYDPFVTPQQLYVDVSGDVIVPVGENIAPCDGDFGQFCVYEDDTEHFSFICVTMVASGRSFQGHCMALDLYGNFTAMLNDERRQPLLDSVRNYFRTEAELGTDHRLTLAAKNSFYKLMFS